MGMFKWLKRELRSGSRERSKSSLGFEQINSPQNKQNGNLNDFSRDEDYLRKLSKFNEWRSSQVGLKNDQGDKTPNVRRTSQADFTPQSESSKQIRYSLDNHHMQYKHLEINDINFSTPQNRTKHAENIYVTDRSQTDPVKKSRELARIDMTFNRSFNKSQRRKSRNKNNLESPTNGDVDDQVPDAFLQRENSLPYQSTEDTYQYVVNKHGDVVEYALPYTERSVDVTKRDLSDIIENESNSDRWSAKENDTYSITDSIDTKTRKNVPNLVSRCGTNAPNDKVGKRLSEVDMKSATSTLEKRRHVNRQSLVDEVQPDDHNKEFLDAIDDLVSLGRWSKRQLEDKGGLGKVRKNCNVPVMLSQLEPIDPSSDFLNCPTIHISCLFIEDKPFLKQRDSILEWRKATWCKEEVFIRSSKPELIHLHRTQTAMARDVHVLRNVPHKNIALLMALAYDDDDQVVTIMEPFTNTLYQLLHEQPYQVPWNLSKYTMILHQICSALNFLHNRGYIHTNISSHCILIDFANSRAKLSGFELAVGVDRNFKQYYYPNGEAEEVDVESTSILGRHSATNKEIRKKATRSNEKLPSSEDITTSVDCNKNFTFTKIDPTNNGGEAWDFCIWGEEQRATDRTVLASYQWQAPELFNTTNSTSVRPCLGSDIYSMGLVVLECCTGCVPWRGVSLQEISKKYRNSESVDIPAKVDNKYTNLIIKATVLKPKLRILTVSDFMEELQTNFQSADDLDIKTPYQNENFGSHSRLQSILIQNRTISQTEPEESYFNHQEDTYNIDDCFNKTQDSIDKKQSNMQKYYTELNANKIEFSDEDVRRMTCSDFLDELKRQTEDLKTKNQSYNMFSSPLVNESNNSQYYSMNDKTNLTNTVLSPIVDGDSNPKGKFLLNITPKFYTPLQIQTPVTDLSVTNYNNAKSQDSVYSFDIEDYELPETPIARNTKIRKNAWLSEPKHKNTSQNLNETRNISENFNGTKNFSDAFVNPGEVYEEMERLRDDINKTFDKILENQQSEELIKKHISPKLLHSEKSDADEVFSTPEAEELIKKHISPKLLHSEKSDADEVFSTPEANFVNQGSESVRAIRRRERLARINNVKTKLNDMLSKSLTCGASCMTTSTPSRVQSSSLNYDIGQKERLQASPVKPASHSRETTFVLQNQNWTRDSKFSRFSNLSPPYNVEAIKPANHHDECNTLPRDHITSSGRQSPTVVEISDEAKKVQQIQQQAAIDHFENSLWKMEKNKCELKRADFIANNMDKDLKAFSTQTADDKIDSCEEISENQVEENCLNIYEQPIIDNYDANITRDKEKVDQIQQDQNNLKLDTHNLDTSEKSLVPKMASDDILDCVHDFNEKLFIDEATLESNVPEVPIPESTLPKPNNSSTLPKSSTAKFSDYFPLTDFSRYTTLPSKISTRIIVAPDRGFFSQICRKETQSPINRRVSVLEIAKIFEKRSRDSRNEKLSHDSSLSRQRTRQMSFRRNVKEFEKMNVNKSEVFSAEVASEAEFLKNRKSSEFPEFGKKLDQSFIYNNALEEKDAEDADKVCTHCGSHVNPPETNSKNQQRESLGRRLTLSPELADLCANLLRDQFADLDARYLLSSAIDLAQNGGSLRRCQAFAAIQDARSIEDLYIDDEFTSEEQLGSHMQLFSCRNSHDDILDCSTTSSIADSFDIYYREDDFYPEVNLEEYPLSIDLTQEGDENSADGAEEAVDNSLGKDQDNDQVKDQGKDQGKDQFGFEPRLTQILEENSDCESEDSLRRRKYTDEEEMESSL